MSSKEKEKEDTSQKKTSLLDMQDKLFKKNVSFQDVNSPTKTPEQTADPADDDEDHDLSEEEDDTEFVKKHHDFGNSQMESMNAKKSMMGEASWYDKVFFSWVFNIIQKAQTNNLTLEDFGGLRDDDRIEDKIRKVEAEFQAQKTKNIFLAVVTAFKGRFIFGFLCCIINMLVHMSFPVIITEIIKYMQDKDNNDFMYGFRLIALLVFLNIFMHMFDCHGWYNNINTGTQSAKCLKALVHRKMLRLTAATSKNYEPGQIHSVLGASHRIVWFCYEASDFILTPMWVVYCCIRLFMTMGWTFSVGLSLMVVCYKFDRYFNKKVQNIRHEEQKLQEKRMNITSESFENIKTLKFYGWDDYFKNEILKIRAEQIAKNESTQAIMLILSFVWKFLPNLMAAISFTIFVYLGHTFDLPQASEMIMLFTWIQGDFNRIMHFQEQLAELRLCIKRIQDYLEQDEVTLKQIVQKSDQNEKKNKSEYAVRIHNQSFSWGLQTVDIDELFDKLQKEIHGNDDEQKTKDQLMEERDAKKKKEEELKKQRKMDSIICLKDIDVHIKKGSFVCIIGKVGSGKSSLLSALIGDLLPVPKDMMEAFKKGQGWEKELDQDEAQSFMAELVHYNKTKKESNLEVNGTVAYTQQSPWIRNQTLRANIIYNQPFDYEKYVDTIMYCELERDLDNFREGDKTLIGEKGVNMSGGQKARMGLARAVYQDKEIYLMDDPISALDAHVRKQIINNVYFGILKDRTRILVTHAIDFLNQADHIIMMDQGKIVCQGNFDVLSKNKEFNDLMDLNKLNKNLKKEKEQKTKSIMLTKNFSKMKSIFEDNTESFGIQNEDRTEPEKIHTEHKFVTKHKHKNDNDDKDKDELDSNESLSVCLTDEEESEMDSDYDPLSGTTGSKDAMAKKPSSKLLKAQSTLGMKKLKTVVFPIRQSRQEKRDKLIQFSKGQGNEEGELLDEKADAQAEIKQETIDQLIKYYGSIVPFIAFLLIHIGLNSLRSYSAYLIGEWATDKSKQTETDKFQMQVAKIFGVVLVIALLEIAKERTTFKMICNTLKSVHNDVVQRIMQAPINLFFDVTPNGTIMKRFSEDMQIIEHLIRSIDVCVWLAIDLSFTFFMLGCSNYIIYLVVPVLLVYIKYVWNYTLKAKRQAILMLQTIGAQVDNHQNEVMSGTSSIRAMGSEDHAIGVQSDNQNAFTLTQQISFATFVWYSSRLLAMSCFSTLFTGSLVLYSKKDFEGDSIMAAMAFQRVVHIGYLFNGLVHVSGDFEEKLAKIQKCFKLLTIPQETTDQPKVTGKWPTRGKIEFKDVELKYRPTTELVLNKLKFTIQGGEKIGVVGRTGAGKSTITLALTRIIEICGGQVHIDGVDINKHDMLQLRQVITIIPQDPCLFKGSLRFNLDPLEICKDEEILGLLKESGIEELILKKKKEDEEKKKELEKLLTPEELAKLKDEKKTEDDSLLNFQVQAGGQNLSSGEKSLICICRAILRRNKIVILDEATANIDIQTEQTIQKLIQKNFKDCTMITVAHRLQTIIESDKVLVLDKGRVAEFDSPKQLLKNPESHFTKLVNQMQEEEKEKEGDKKLGEGEKKE